MEDSIEVGSTDYGVLEPTQSVEFLVPWVLSELSSTKTEPSSREGEKDQGRDSAPFGEQSDHSQKVVPAYRQTASSNQGSIPLAPLFYRKLQQALQRVLEQSDQDYSAQLILSTGEHEELQWWL